MDIIVAHQLNISHDYLDDILISFSKHPAQLINAVFGYTKRVHVFCNFLRTNRRKEPIGIGIGELLVKTDSLEVPRLGEQRKADGEQQNTKNLLHKMMSPLARLL